MNPGEHDLDAGARREALHVLRSAIVWRWFENQKRVYRGGSFPLQRPFSEHGWRALRQIPTEAQWALYEDALEPLVHEYRLPEETFEAACDRVAAVAMRAFHAIDTDFWKARKHSLAGMANNDLSVGDLYCMVSAVRRELVRPLAKVEAARPALPAPTPEEHRRAVEEAMAATKRFGAPDLVIPRPMPARRSAVADSHVDTDDGGLDERFVEESDVSAMSPGEAPSVGEEDLSEDPRPDDDAQSDVDEQLVQGHDVDEQLELEANVVTAEAEEALADSQAAARPLFGPGVEVRITKGPDANVVGRISSRVASPYSGWIVTARFRNGDRFRAIEEDSLEVARPFKVAV